MEALSKFREELNELDEQLVELLGKRYQVIREVGHFKKANTIPMMQSKRVEKVKDRCAEMGKKVQLDPDFIRGLYTLIIDEACRIEDLIMDG